MNTYIKGGSIQPRGATWNQKQHNRTYSSEKKKNTPLRKGEIPIVDSRHARLSLLRPRRQSFVFFTHFYGYCTPFGGPACLALGSFPYSPYLHASLRRGARRAGFPRIFYLFSRKVGTCISSLGPSGRSPRKGYQMSSKYRTEYRGKVGWCCVVLCCVVSCRGSHTHTNIRKKGNDSGRQNRKGKKSAPSFTVNLIILGLARSFVRYTIFV